MKKALVRPGGPSNWDKPCGETPWFRGLEWTEDIKCHDQEGLPSIHGEVKEAESMKSHYGDVGSRMEQHKEGKNSYCSLLPFDYIYVYALWKQKIVECMYDLEWNVCICLSKFVNAGMVNSLPKDGHEWARVPVGGRHEKYESLLDKTWTVMPIG